MKKHLLPLLILCFLFLSKSTLFSQTKVIPDQPLQASGLFFGATMNPTNITVTFSGVSDRWIALGIGSSMSFADVLMYSNGQIGNLHAVGWNDYYNPNNSSTTLDAIQNWTIISTNVALGQRTVVASRVLNTGDANDAVISFASSSLNLIWAKGASPNFTISYHGGLNRGFGISLPWLSQPSPSFSVLNNTVCLGSSVTFTNATTGGQTTYTWNFGGANLATSTLTNPVVTYTAPGVYSVALTASNAVGTSSITQLNYITVTPTVIPAVSIIQSGGVNPLCSGSPATFSASFTNGGPGPIFQWQVNGVNVGANTSTFSSAALTNSSVIRCIMTANSVCAVPNTATSSVINLTVSSSAPASVSVALTSGNPMCIGTTAQFSATPGNGGNFPTYQWKVNNVNVGSNSPTFTSNTLSNNDVVTCQIVSSSSCAATPTAISSGITVTVSVVLIPSVSIILGNGSNPACSGIPATFSASPFNGGNSPSYQWLVNGVITGNNNAVFTSSVLTNGSVVQCIMTSNSSCASPNTATSSVITMTVNPVPSAPVITPSGNINLCSGKSLTLSSSANSGNNWSNGANTQNIVVNSQGTYSVSQTQLGCTSAMSSPVIVSIIPSPTPALSNIAPLCKDDNVVTLQGTPTGGTYTGTAVTGNSFHPGTAGTGTFTIVYTYIDANTCSGTASANLIVTECLNVKSSSKASELLVYPNPAKDQVMIVSGTEKIEYIKLMDLSGRLIIYKKVDQQTNVILDLSKEIPGIYFIETGIGSRTFYTRINKTN